MLFAGREVSIGKNCARGLEYVLKTKGTDFPNTDRPRSANNVFIFFCGKLLLIIRNICVDFLLKQFNTVRVGLTFWTTNVRYMTGIMENILL